MTTRLLFFCNREARQVPLNWRHPVDRAGRWVPLFKYSEEAIEEELRENPGATRAQVTSDMLPDCSNLAEDEIGISAYETTSEGTPISPVFPNTPEGRFELASYCAQFGTVFANQRCADVYTWCQILFGGETVVVDYDKGTVSVPRPQVT